jgi:cytoskeleton protein RodZ
VGGNQLETAIIKEARKASLGESLVAARERRGLSRETVVQQTHIPAHYVQMLEEDDYRRISDQLYLLPFLRKYADFLDIDQDETAMRLLREVQRADNSPSPVRRNEALDDIRRYCPRSWTKPMMFSGLIAVIIGASIAQSRHSDTDTASAPKLQSSHAAVVLPSSPGSNGTMNSLPATESPGVARSDSSAPQPTTFETRTSTGRDPRSTTQAMMMPAASPNKPPTLPQGKTSGARQVPNH